MTLCLGVSLLEILISLLLLSLLLLAFDAVQVNTLQASKSAYFYSIAAQQITALTERVRIFQSQGLSAYLQEWDAQNQTLLPQGRSLIEGKYPYLQITLCWGHEVNQDKKGMSGCLKKNLTY